MLDEVHFVQCHLLLGVGGWHHRCIVPYGVAVAMARMGLRCVMIMYDEHAAC